MICISIYIMCYVTTFLSFLCYSNELSKGAQSALLIYNECVYISKLNIEFFIYC